MNILIVDDDEAIRTSIYRFLIQLGHTVKKCSNGKDSLKMLENGMYHLVLSDIRMPNMDGYELLKNIKGSSQLKNIEVVLITGYGNIRGAVKAMQIGAYDYILKPIQIDEISVVLERVSEYLTLKKENKTLTENFEKHVNIATEVCKKKLEDYKKAYAREFGNAKTAIFSNKLQAVYNSALKFHKYPDIPILIEGETGVGKELVARYIHFGENVVSTPFIDINCAAISPNLFESELFGYERGAFTGSNPKGQIGKIELAEGGSILLDEISEISIDYQAKLLRFLQEKEYYKVGGLKKIKSNARIICTTNQNLLKGVANGTFRKDLFYRLRVGLITVSPLRERVEEIVPLCMSFLQEFAEKYKSGFRRLSAEACKILKHYHWPGNVRELRSTIERIVILWDDEEIRSEHLFFLTKTGENRDIKPANLYDQLNGKTGLPKSGIKLEDWIFGIVEKALIQNKGNKVKTAHFLGITRSALYTYLRKYDDAQTFEQNI